MRLSRETISYLLTSFEALGNRYQDTKPDDIVRDYLAGKCSFDYVLRAYKGLLIKKSESYIPGYTGDEVFQELALRTELATHLWDPNNGTQFITYLYKALDNHLRKLYREETQFDKRRLNSIEMDSYEQLIEDGYDQVDYNPELSLVELVEGIPLSPQERICVELAYEGYQNVDIAKALGLTKGRITTIIQGLRSRFQFLLSQ
jgi:RNA polymerase sigma factor (sigma-70 family)